MHRIKLEIKCSSLSGLEDAGGSVTQAAEQSAEGEGHQQAGHQAEKEHQPYGAAEHLKQCAIDGLAQRQGADTHS